MTTPSGNLPDNAASDERPVTGPEPASGCDLFEPVAAELALGSLTGSERSSALAHLEGCERCASLLQDLSAAADALLLVAPEADPPAGFEVRWLARLANAPATSVPVPVAGGSRSPVIPLRRRARLLLAAAAAAVVLAGAGVGVGMAVAHKPLPTAAAGHVRLAALHSVSSYDGDGAVGEVAITPGDPSWMVMTVQKPGWSGQVECVVTEHGQSRQVGTFWLHDGTGSWAVLLTGSGASITSAQVRELTGSVLASASFTT